MFTVSWIVQFIKKAFWTCSRDPSYLLQLLIHFHWLFIRPYALHLSWNNFTLLILFILGQEERPQYPLLDLRLQIVSKVQKRNIPEGLCFSLEGMQEKSQQKLDFSLQKASENKNYKTYGNSLLFGCWRLPGLTVIFLQNKEYISYQEWIRSKYFL